MTESEKVLRDKAVYFVVGKWPEVAKQAPLRPEVFEAGKEYILAIIPVSQEVDQRKDTPRDLTTEAKRAVAAMQRPQDCERCGIEIAVFKTKPGVWLGTACWLKAAPGEKV